MMGERRVDQAALFYEFSLDRHVPSEHMLRSIDRFVDLEELRAGLAPFYSPIGRPSIDPELLIRMLLVGYCFGIRSERRLCEEVHLNLAYRWFCRLGLDGDVPDHSTFSKNRHGRFRRAICCASCSRPWCDAAWPRAWSAARASPSTPA
jgi:transposase